MRNFGANNAAYLATTGGIIARNLLRVTGVDPATSITTTIEIWDGQTDTTFTADGTAGNFVGTGGSIGVEDIEYIVGMDAHRYQVTLTGLPDTIEAMFKTFNFGGGVARVYSVLLDPVVPVSDVWRNVSGFVDDVKITTGAVGKSDSIVLTVATSAMLLHFGIDRKLSDAAHQRAVPGVLTSGSTTYALTGALQTVALGAVSQIDMTLVGGASGSGGYSPNGNWKSGNPGQPTTVAIKDSTGAVVASFTAPSDGSFLTGAITGVSGGSVEITVGYGGAGGGDGATGANGSAVLNESNSAPTPDLFLQYQATAGEVKSIWS